MKISTFCDVVTGASVGATGPTSFSNLGTITLRSDAKRVLGLIGIMANTAGTTAEGYNAVIRMKSSDLKVGDQDYVLGACSEGGVATNNNPIPVHADLIPLDIPAQGGEAITLEVAGSIALTTGFDGVAGILYANGMIPQIAIDAIRNFAKIPGKGGQFQVLNDAKDIARAALASAGSQGAAASMKIPAWARAIIGVRPIYFSDALPTTTESHVGYCELTSSMGDFTPQKFPVLTGVGASLGTAITGPIWPLVKEYPVWIPTTGKNETVDAYNVGVVASTGAVVHTCGIRYL